ncbi:saccharopine dehydrogenase NADP-binding domain-containing protein [Vibrio sp. SS-MA-C1-2]|uniref:shikimate dehydrogenase family protein n=1 Tax=Vibrio sp. SS-MA-C1-2 TaxID=2908646 RepID=UPI001F44A2C4|nr:saccharopine dehydrogenase NADP-binding domain-containing protein [Vibrio sp. SS-MA-C1-2]UJF17851.1 saccharopine dehydrogenase NADP-binding domain-containing protein [Vibrio sp. SS-MA-C1-2]
MISCRLIGINIDKSSAPSFHNQLANELSLSLDYQLSPLSEPEFSVFENCVKFQLSQNVNAMNITFPYKEMAIKVANWIDHSAKVVGAANTLIYHNKKLLAYNTDYTGFIQAFRQSSINKPGKVVVIGCGGVGKAVIHGLIALQASEIIIYEQDTEKAEHFLHTLPLKNRQVKVINKTLLESAVRSANGVLNCTPIGHHNYSGIPILAEWLDKQQWVFDAVYTPIETAFIQEAKGKGIKTLSGFELFFHQAVDAFKLFIQHDPSISTCVSRNPYPYRNQSISEQQLQAFRDQHFSQN